MNEQQSRFIAPVAIAAVAALLTLIPMQHGSIRIIQALWLIAGFDNLGLAALIHGLVLGVLAYLLVWWSRRRQWPLDGNFVAAGFFAGYVVAYFAVGAPMVG